MAPSPDTRPVLLFFTSTQSGPARRMSSLVAWVTINEKRRLRVLEVDIDRHRPLAGRLEVRAAPALLLLEHGEVIGRLEGSATSKQIAALLQDSLQEVG